jgi:hypothetical protein
MDQRPTQGIDQTIEYTVTELPGSCATVWNHTPDRASMMPIAVPAVSTVLVDGSAPSTATPIAAGAVGMRTTSCWFVTTVGNVFVISTRMTCTPTGNVPAAPPSTSRGTGRNRISSPAAVVVDAGTVGSDVGPGVTVEFGMTGMVDVVTVEVVTVWALLGGAGTAAEIPVANIATTAARARRRGRAGARHG